MSSHISSRNCNARSLTLIDLILRTYARDSSKFIYNLILIFRLFGDKTLGIFTDEAGKPIIDTSKIFLSGETFRIKFNIIKKWTQALLKIFQPQRDLEVHTLTFLRLSYSNKKQNYQSKMRLKKCPNGQKREKCGNIPSTMNRVYRCRSEFQNFK